MFNININKNLKLLFLMSFMQNYSHGENATNTTEQEVGNTLNQEELNKSFINYIIGGSIILMDSVIIYFVYKNNKSLTHQTKDINDSINKMQSDVNTNLNKSTHDMRLDNKNNSKNIEKSFNDIASGLDDKIHNFLTPEEKIAFDGNIKNINEIHQLFSTSHFQEIRKYFSLYEFFTKNENKWITSNLIKKFIDTIEKEINTLNLIVDQYIEFVAVIKKPEEAGIEDKLKDILKELNSLDQTAKNIVTFVGEHCPNFEKDIEHFYSVKVQKEKIDFNVIKSDPTTITRKIKKFCEDKLRLLELKIESNEKTIKTTETEKKELQEKLAIYNQAIKKIINNKDNKDNIDATILKDLNDLDSTKSILPQIANATYDLYFNELENHAHKTNLGLLKYENNIPSLEITQEKTDLEKWKNIIKNLEEMLSIKPTDDQTLKTTKIEEINKDYKILNDTNLFCGVGVEIDNIMGRLKQKHQILSEMIKIIQATKDQTSLRQMTILEKYKEKLT